MALATYTDLLAAVASWADRTDLTSVIPDFVTAAESRINRDLRVRRMVTNTTLTTTSGTQTLALPTDYLEAENLTLSGTSPPGALSVITPELMDRKYPANYQTGQPVVYTTVGSNLILGPTPDGAYALSLDYYQRLGLASSSTNWVMTYNPMVYLAGSMCELGMYLGDADRVALWDSRYRAEVAQLQASDDAGQRSGSTMRVRAI